MRLAVVGDAPWNELADAVAVAHDHVHVEHLSPRVALPLAAFNASRFDVVAVAPAWAEPMVEIAAAPATARVAAHGLLAEHGPSLFVPSPDGGFAIAGGGIVNPSSMLLAAALTLEYGLGSPAAASTLAGAVSAALVDGPQTPDLLRRGVGATTPRVHLARRRRLPALEPQRRVLGGRVRAWRAAMNGADAVLRSLEAEGVEVMFGLPGGAILPLYDAMARGTTVRHVLARHEQGAGHMAEGYARASGRVGVAVATSGPGATNLVTPIADAWMDSTPLVCITGQVQLVPDRHGRIPGVRHHRHHDPDRQAFVARAGRERDPARHEGGVPRRQHGPLRPGARRHPARRAGGGDSSSSTPTRSTSPAGSRPAAGIRGRSRRRRRRSPRRSGPSSTSAAAC